MAKVDVDSNYGEVDGGRALLKEAGRQRIRDGNDNSDGGTALKERWPNSTSIAARWLEGVFV